MVNFATGMAFWLVGMPGATAQTGLRLLISCCEMERPS